MTAATPVKPSYLTHYYRGEQLFSRALLHAADETTPELLKLRNMATEEASRHGAYNYAGLPSHSLLVSILDSRPFPEHDKPGQRHISIDPMSADSNGFKPQKLQEELDVVLPRITSHKPLTSSIEASYLCEVPPATGWRKLFSRKPPGLPAKEWVKYPRKIYTFEDGEGVIQSLNHSSHPAISAMMKQVNHYEALTEGIRDANDRITDQPTLWARIAHGRKELAGDYFPAQALVDKATHFNWPIDMGALFDHHGTEILQAAVDTMDKQHGIKRLRFLDKGRSSAVFETVPDAKGMVQLLILSEYNLVGNLAAPHPTVLPDRTSNLIQLRNQRLLLRTTAKLLPIENTLERAEALRDLITATGAVPHDLHKEPTRNTRQYRTASGEIVTFAIDPGAVAWKKSRIQGIATEPFAEEKELTIQQWEQEPKLQTHRAAAAEINHVSHTQNTFSPELREGLAELPPESCLHAAYHQKGMYPAELKAISLEALKKEGGQNYTQHLRAGIAAFDTSQHPLTGLLLNAAEAVEHCPARLAFASGETALGTARKMMVTTANLAASVIKTSHR